MKSIYVREHTTNKPIHYIDVTGRSERSIDRIVDGMDINLNHELYWVDGTCPEEDEPQCEN